MVLFKFCDLIIESNIALGTAAAEEVPSDWLFRAIPDVTPSPNSFEWFHQINLPDSTPWLLLGRQGKSYVLRFLDLADFVISIEERVIDCFYQSICSVETVTHLLIDQVLPRLVYQQGRLVLHASAVLGPNGVIAFLGDTGWGKSTIAASLCSYGFPHLTDDCLLLVVENGQLMAIPSYSGFRLWSDSISAIFPQGRSLSNVAHYTDKQRISADDGALPFCGDRAPVQAFYFLGSPEADPGQSTATISQVSDHEALIEFAKQTYRLDVTDRERLKEEFESLAYLANNSVLRRVTIPRDLSYLPNACQTIVDDLMAIGSVALVH
ncbi:MAG: hypothetical protein ACREBG_12310 [Pyrinomonadaceae bacterium]